MIIKIVQPILVRYQFRDIWGETVPFYLVTLTGRAARDYSSIVVTCGDSLAGKFLQLDCVSVGPLPTLAIPGLHDDLRERFEAAYSC